MLFRNPIKTPVSFRSPFAELDRIRREMDILTGNFLRQDGVRGRLSPGVFPAINLSENADNYYIRAELPGLKADELDIQSTGNSISIAGQRKIEAEAENAKYHRREREAGRFSRIIELPGDIDPDKITASLTNGILEITVAKAAIAKPKKITIK